MFRDEEFLNQHSTRKLYHGARANKIIGDIYDDIVANNNIINEAIYIKMQKLCDKYNQGYTSKMKASEVIWKHIVQFNWKIEYIIALACGMCDKDIKNHFKEFIIEPEQTKDVQNEKSMQHEDSKGIYGIYIDKRLIYIGMTYRTFTDRWNEHLREIDKGSNKLYLYKWLREHGNPKISFKKLIDVKELKVENHGKYFSKHEIECMELALIHTLKPVCNYAGVNGAYSFV